MHDQLLHDAPASKRRIRMKKGVMVKVTGGVGEMEFHSIMGNRNERGNSVTLWSPAGSTRSTSRGSVVSGDATPAHERKVCNDGSELGQ